MKMVEVSSLTMLKILRQKGHQSLGIWQIKIQDMQYLGHN